jgi:inhibitor of KinA sporulation pathway (predicted exonuclease)
VDKHLVDEFKSLCDETRTSVWTKRVKAIDDIQDFAVQNAQKIKTHQSSFIGLVDAYV